jgi:hypothetical protein
MASWTKRRIEEQRSGNAVFAQRLLRPVQAFGVQPRAVHLERRILDDAHDASVRPRLRDRASGADNPAALAIRRS